MRYQIKWTNPRTGKERMAVVRAETATHAMLTYADKPVFGRAMFTSVLPLFSAGFLIFSGISPGGRRITITVERI